jgi:hypothetical protein
MFCRVITSGGSSPRRRHHRLAVARDRSLGHGRTIEARPQRTERPGRGSIDPRCLDAVAAILGGGGVHPEQPWCPFEPD